MSWMNRTCVSGHRVRRYFTQNTFQTYVHDQSVHLWKKLFGSSAYNAVEWHRPQQTYHQQRNHFFLLRILFIIGAAWIIAEQQKSWKATHLRRIGMINFFFSSFRSVHLLSPSKWHETREKKLSTFVLCALLSSVNRYPLSLFRFENWNWKTMRTRAVWTITISCVTFLIAYTITIAVNVNSSTLIDVSSYTFSYHFRFDYVFEWLIADGWW